MNPKLTTYVGKYFCMQHPINVTHDVTIYAYHACRSRTWSGIDDACRSGELKLSLNGAIETNI